MNSKANTIDDVLEQLDAIIAKSKANNDPLGFFAYIYRRTTAQIKQAILDGKFEDNTRMEKFDVLFANKYLEAYHNFHKGLPVCNCWGIAFQAKKDRLTILQHIILGMNAHINFDLGISAAEYSAGGRIDDLKNDFMAVNHILADLVDELQVKVGRVSRIMFLLDWASKSNDEAVLNFSMEKARKQGWNFGLAMSVLDGRVKLDLMNEVDEMISKLGGIVMRPPGRILAYTIKIISFFESKDVKKILSRLAAD